MRGRVGAGLLTLLAVGLVAASPASAENLGSVRGYAFQSMTLSDRIELQVNQHNGNLLVTQADVDVPGGDGPNLAIHRVYNSLDTSAGAFGAKAWRLTTAQDFSCTYAASSVTLRMPSGASEVFNLVSGSYVTPIGYDLKLVDTGSAFTLTENQSQMVYRFSYGAGHSNCQLASITDRNGRAITLSYNASHQIADIADSQNRHTTFDYASGRVSEIDDPAGRAFDYDYNASGLLSAYTDPSGNDTSYSYNADGRLSQITTPGDSVTKITYWPAGDARSGRVKTVQRILSGTTGPATQFNYDFTTTPSTPTSTVTDPNGNVTSYTFNATGRPTKVVDAKGRIATTTYTANANVADYASPAQTGATKSSVNAYDTNGNQTSSTTLTAVGSSNNTTQSKATFSTPGTVQGGTYLPSFTQTPQDTATGSTTQGTSYTYNPQGNLLSATDASGGSTVGSVSLTYRTGADGKPGELATSVDPNGNVTTYNYDTHGNLTSIAAPSITLTPGGSALGSTTISYSGGAGKDLALSRPTTVTDQNGKVTAYTYDDLGRVITETKSSGGTVLQSYALSYDDDGNLLENAVTQAGSTQHFEYSYDTLNRQTDETLPSGATNIYTYDANSNLKSLSDSGGTVTYGYDQINRQSSIQEPGAASAITYTYADNADNSQTVTIALPNGVTTTEKLDPAGRLSDTISTTAGGTVRQHLAYSYARSSTGKQQELVSSEADTVLANTTSYLYDPLDRLLSATKSAGGAFSYTYDAAGNILTKTVGSTTTRYKYNQGNELCWSLVGTSSNGCGTTPAGGTGFSYDAAGNETAASGVRTATYNAGEQLSSLTPAGGSAIAASYAFPGQFYRTSLGATTTQQTLLGLSKTTTAGTSDYVTRDKTGLVVSQRRPSASTPNKYTYALTDQLGSTRTLLDSTGAVVRRYRYQPYGADDSPSGSWTTTTPIQYAAGQLDATTGLYHFGERYYDTNIMRWTQQDPVNQMASLTQANRYGYVGGDPIDATDLAGLSLLSHVVSAVKGCIEGAVKGPEIPGGTYIVKVGTRYFSKVIPQGRAAGCAEGALKSQL
jgi:RHS repeat-associated protein